MLTSNEYNKLRIEIEKILGGDFDKFDFNAYVDPNLTYEENLSQIKEDIKAIGFNSKDTINSLKSGKYEEQKEDYTDKCLAENKEPLLKRLFGGFRIVGFAGSRNKGKTNNLMDAIRDFRKINQTSHIYYYGLEEDLVNWIKQNIPLAFEISKLEHLSDKKDCLVVLDEFQKLNLNDRRYRELLNMFCDFVYHNNCWVIMSSPSIREFNSVIGGKIERWVLKSIKLHECINGSQLKMTVLNYKGRYKSINDLVVPNDKAIVINDGYEEIISFEYIKEADTKLKNKDIFSFSQEKVMEKSVTKLSGKSQ